MGYSIFDDTMVDMPWPEIKQAIEQNAIALLPIAVIEEHGPHMGLGVDLYIPYMICRIMKRTLEARSIKTLIAPPYYWGINGLTSFFPGSFMFRKETVKAAIYDILSSFKRWGINHVFTVNWHAEYGHNMAIFEALKEARNDTGIKAYAMVTDMDVKRLGLTGNEEYLIVHQLPPPEEPPSKYPDMHAGSLETGAMLSYFPTQVNAKLARTLKATELTYDDIKALRARTAEAQKVIPLGYFGDPAGFNPKAAKKFVEENALGFANLIEKFIKSQ